MVVDACKWYNSTHDLCSVMARLAAERAGLAMGRRIACYEYAVTEAPSDEGEALDLDDAALSRKTAAAHRYEALSLEVENLIARVGIDALRREVLRPSPRTASGRSPGQSRFILRDAWRVARRGRLVQDCDSLRAALPAVRGDADRSRAECRAGPRDWYPAMTVHEPRRVLIATITRDGHRGLHA